MRVLQKFLFLFLPLVFILSCAKEFSAENPDVKFNIYVGANCVVSKVIAVDTFNNKGEIAFIYNYDSTKTTLLNVAQVDSINNNAILFSKAFTKSNDTLRIDANQYFVVDLAKQNRVKTFVGQSNPNNPNAQILIHQFNYDTLSDKLISKEVKLPGTSVFLKTEYAYTGNNLTGFSTKLTQTNIIIKSGTITFDNIKPKNYFNLIPSNEELAPYIAALNLGAKSSNMANKIITRNFNQTTGTIIDSTVTNFSNYKLSNDGYLLSVDVAGAATEGLPFTKGRNRFGYTCK